MNLVGITKAGKVEDMDISDLDGLLEVNTKGALRLTKLAIPIMRKQRSGKIINISSLSGLIAFPNYGYYSASKFALEAINQSLRYEVFRDDIEIINVEPGAITFDNNTIVSGTGKSVRERFPLVAKLLPLVSAIDVSKKIEETIMRKNNSLNILIGRDTKLTYFAKRFLPDILWDKIIKYFFGKTVTK